MPRYIDAEKCAQKITALVELEWGYVGIDEDIKEIFNTIPAADVVPVVHGYWRPIYSNKSCENVKRAMWYECSECNRQISDGTYSRGIDYEFCPYCGTRMDGENNV